MTMGAGLSGRIALQAIEAPAAGTSASVQATNARNAARLDALAIAPGIAPWVGGRIGIRDANEAGLAYSGRAVRLDARHAFALGMPTLSVGLGASVLTPARPRNDTGTESVYGGGVDIPVILGVTSQSDLYSLWIGPRGGVELLRGNVLGEAEPGSGQPTGSSGPVGLEVDARHFFVGFVAGLRVGFRHVHLAIEVDGAYHFAEGNFGALSTKINQFSLTPAGALIVSF